MKTHKDVFGYIGIMTDDHIWPVAKNGSQSKENVQSLTKKSNQEKGDRTKGKINGIRFAIIPKGKTDSEKVIGKMRILTESGWVDVKN